MSFVYEVGPINYFNLSEPERNAVLSGFAAALQQLSSAVVFYVRLDTMSVVVGNELYSVNYRRYFLESDQALEGFLATMGLQEKYVRLMEMPGYKVASNLPRYAVLDNGDLAKAYTITGVASDLDIAFLAKDMGEGSIIDKTDEVRIRIEPLRGRFDSLRENVPSSCRWVSMDTMHWVTTLAQRTTCNQDHG
ncbi:MAG: hypothetical protein LYZ69_02295 [Nitrososphaerales archaeon]|nr:hypothetical protein [Nitrososphaerales archaeon]